MTRPSDVLDWLARRPAACATCGSVLVAIAGPGELRIQVCPNCDQTAGVAKAERVPHARLHFTEIPGCPECIESRRART